MLTAADEKKILSIGEALAETDEEFMEGLLKFQSGINVGIVIGMARASGKDVELETAIHNRDKHLMGAR